MRHPLILSALPLLALAACTTSDKQYPSLLPRPIETQSMAEPASADPVAKPDATLDSKIAEIVATLNRSAGDFTASAQKAEAAVAVARGMAQGTDPWLNAQTALAELGSKRAPLLAAQSELDELAIERGKAGQPPYPSLDAAVARADTLANAQAARIASLEAALKSN